MSLPGLGRPWRRAAAEAAGLVSHTSAPANDLEAAWEALRGVYDPELCLDLVSLGLVYDVRDEEGTLVVEMTLTTPGCPASEGLPEMAREAILDVTSGTVPVEVRVVWDPPWSPAMLSAAAADALGFRAR